ncbi:MAG: hypothetical protein GY948_08450 [Alphaproteobacteria bacterium]|nr:hypothetical protein [Alphaproteobacteria bacterium]
MTTGNGNRSWRDRLGLQEQDEALPKLSDQFDEAESSEGRVLPPPSGSAVEGDVALAEPDQAESTPKRVLPPPPPADGVSGDDVSGAEDTASVAGASPAAKTFAERLRARREAAERAGTVATEGLGSGLHLRPPVESNGEDGTAELSGVDDDKSSRIIPPPSVPKPDPEPEPENVEAAPAAAEDKAADDRRAREPLFEPITPKSDAASAFERTPFSAEPQKSDNYSGFDKPAGAPKDKDVSLPRFSAKVDDDAPARSGGRDSTPPPVPGSEDYASSRRLPTDSPEFSARNYERPEGAPTRPIQQEYSGDYAQEDGLYDDTWYEDNQQQQQRYQGAHARALDNVDGGDGYDERQRRRPELGRPTASDYADAYYDDYDDQYEDDEPQRRGPWLLFAGLACVGLIAAALIWFYLQTQQGSSTASNSPPVVSAPKSKVKVDPPRQSSVPAAQQTKLFYDRIVGENTVEGERILPREEKPLDPGAATKAPAAGGTNATEPQPLRPLTPDQLDTGDLPVPLPPPLPGSTSGSLEPSAPGTTNIAQSTPSTSSTSVAKVDQSQTVEPAGLTTTLPLPGSNSTAEATELPQLQPPKGSDDAGVAKAVTSLPGSIIPRPRAKPAAVVRAAQARAKKTRVASVSPITAAPTEPLSITPLPGSQPRPVQPAPTPSFGANQNAPSAVSSFQQGSQATQGRRVAAVQQPSPIPAPAPAPQVAVGAGAYVVQLASYKDQASAMNGYQQLRARHPSLLGSYQPLISKKAVGSFGTFYRLQVGPIASAQSGNQICASLLAAGEKDCLVKRR